MFRSNAAVCRILNDLFFYRMAITLYYNLYQQNVISYIKLGIIHYFFNSVCVLANFLNELFFIVVYL